MDFAYSLASDLLECTSLEVLVIPVMLAVSFAWGACLLAKRINARRFHKANLVVGGVVLSVFVSGLLVFKSQALAIAAACVLCAQGLACLACYYCNKRKLEGIVELMIPSKGKEDYLGALRLINSVNTVTMTRGQLREHGKNLVQVMLELGNPDKARRLLDGLDVEPVYRHFMMHNILFLAGDLVGSEEELKLAEDALNAATPLLIRGQIVLNKGVLLINRGDYLSADEQFERARRLFRDEKLDSKGVICCLYENMILNKTRIGEPDGGRSAGDGLIEELGSLLDPDNPYDSLALFNTKLMFLRQLGVCGEELDAHVQSVFAGDRFAMRLSRKEAFHMAVSTASIAAMNFLNPKRPLAYLEAHIDDADLLDPGERLACMQEIANAIAALNGGFLDGYPAMIGYLDDYSLEDATSDLRKHSDSLPEEAVIARYKCLKDRATLASALEQDTRQRTLREVKCLEEIIDLQQRSGLRFPEMEERVNIACLLLESCKSSDDEKKKDEIRALRHIEVVEAYLGEMQMHPFTSVIHIGLSWAYALLGRHGECLGHYESFKALGVPVTHYAPIVRQREFRAAFALRVYGFRVAILAARENARGLDEREMEWFASYESHSGFEEAALLAKFLGIGDVVSVAGKPWFESPYAASATTHGFLPILNLGLVLDPTMHGIENDPVVFSMSSYPLGLPVRKATVVAEKTSGIILPVISTLVDVRGMTEGQGFLGSVYRQICLHAPEGIPTVAELKELMKGAYGPVPFPENA